MTSSPLYGELAIAEHMQPSVAEVLRDIVALDNPEQQYIALGGGAPFNRGRLPANISVEDFDALIEFAANPASSQSLLVRALALEAAVVGINGQNADENIAGEDVMLRREQLRLLVPDDLAKRATYIKSPWGYGFQSIEDYNPRIYQKMVAHLATQEGISENIIFPDWHAIYGADSYYEPDNVPAFALLLLDNLALLKGQPERMPVSQLTKLVPLALEIGKALSPEDYASGIDHNTANFYLSVSRLTRILEFGEDYTGKIEAFLSLGSPESQAYVRELNELYDAATLLKDIFPKEFALGVELGARDLIASALYAVQAHVVNKHRTSVRVPLNYSPGELPLRLKGDEPLQLLRLLKSSMIRLHEVVMDPALRTVSVSQNSDYRLYRLIPETGSDVSVYIRPQGGFSYQPTLEYGRSEGVEASISYNVDTKKDHGSLLEVGKHRNRTEDSRIRIGLDREGWMPLRSKSDVRRPTKNQGMLSLDVGSITGADEWDNTRVGRFLAWGNRLRSEVLCEFPELNHVTRYFTPGEGNADIFAQQARQLLWYYESRRLNLDEVYKHFLGETALGNL